MSKSLSATVSVVVPVHNAAPYLQACLESLTVQGIKCELILVDDGSTDNSAAICRKFLARDGVDVMLVTTACLGVSHARNIGIEHASGEFIAFCDADDMYMPGAIGRMHAALVASADCDIVVGRFCRNAAKGRLQRTFRILPAAEAVEETLYQRPGYHESAWGKLYRRSLFVGKENFVEGRRYEDLEFCPRVYSRARAVAFTDEDVYFYRPNPASFITNWSADRADALWAVDRIMAFVEKSMPDVYSAALSRRFSAYCNIAILARKHGQNVLMQTCLGEIRKMHKAILHDHNSRFKNRLTAALMSLWK